MIAKAVSIWWLIVPVTLVAAVIEMFVPFSAEQAGNQSKAGTFVGFVIGGLIFGLIAVWVWNGVSVRWPDTAPQTYLWIALGVCALLTAGAFGMHWVVKNWTAPILWTVMNLLWALAYGLMVPRLLA